MQDSGDMNLWQRDKYLYIPGTVKYTVTSYNSSGSWKKVGFCRSGKGWGWGGQKSNDYNADQTVCTTGSKPIQNEDSIH